MNLVYLDKFTENVIISIIMGGAERSVFRKSAVVALAAGAVFVTAACGAKGPDSNTGSAPSSPAKSCTYLGEFMLPDGKVLYRGDFNEGSRVVYFRKGPGATLSVLDYARLTKVNEAKNEHIGTNPTNPVYVEVGEQVNYKDDNGREYQVFPTRLNPSDDKTVLVGINQC